METKAYSYIRFSTPDQIKGDSLRRQKEASEKYAKDNGLTLDDSLKYQDLGLSGRKGINRIKGALGRFLASVESGKIEKGSYLLVENLDRLSREQVDDAYDQFRSIIKAGIILVTLQDGMKYSTESIRANWTQLIISITYMARAFDESERKSQRISDAWENKRQGTIKGGLKMTAKAPLWLRLSEDRKLYIPIPEACKTVELIYRLKLSGKGLESIEKELNQRADVWIPPKNKKRLTGGWRKSYIQKILNSRAVIGEFTPTKHGESTTPISNYYPSAIDTELFYNVKALMDRNQGKYFGGQTGKASNLFTHVIHCGICKAPMHYIDKGSLPKGGQYLHCDNAHRKLGCKAKLIRYDEFEKIFFDNFEELNLSDLMPDKDVLQIQINDLKRREISNNQQLKERNLESINLTDSITTTEDKRVRNLLETRLSQNLNSIEELGKDNETIMKELQGLTVELSTIQFTVDTAKEVYGILKACKNESERIILRLKLRMEIRKLVSDIEIYPLEEVYKKVEEIEPGVYQTMQSKFIDFVRIKFNGSRNTRVLYLKRYHEIE